MRYHMTTKSSNTKTGPIPVTTSAEDTCPDACPFKSSGCYAKSGLHLRLHWDAVSDGRRGGSFEDLLSAVRKLPKGQAWRHNQAGDLPGKGNRIAAKKLEFLRQAASHTKGWTYTHKPMTKLNRRIVGEVNAKPGLVINLSANNLKHADELAALDVGPVAVVLPMDAPDTTETPDGRKVVKCPATRDGSNATCASCQLCGKGQRSVIVGFPAHGTAKRAADQIAQG